MLSLLILTLPVIKSTKLVDCPDPIRPLSTLEAFQIENNDTLLIVLQVRKCRKKSDRSLMFFSLESSYQNDEPLEIPVFSYYEEYRDQVPDCTVTVWVPPVVNNSSSKERTDISGETTVLQCDHLITRCTFLSWTCPAFSFERDSERMLIYIMETLSPFGNELAYEWEDTGDKMGMKKRNNKKKEVAEWKINLDSYVVGYLMWLTLIAILVFKFRIPNLIRRGI